MTGFPIQIVAAHALHNIEHVVVTEVGGLLGAVTNDQLKRASFSEGPRGYRCLLLGYGYLRAQSTVNHHTALSCLEAEVAADANNRQATSLLVAVLVRGYLNALPDSKGSDDLQRAVGLAQHAYDLDPQRAPSQLGLYLTRFYEKHFDDAFLAGRVAVAKSPDAPLVGAAVGAGYVARGDYDAGLALLNQPNAQNSDAQSIFLPYIALAAYMRGDVATFERLGFRISTQTSSIGLVIRILACHQKGDADCVLHASRQLRREFPEFCADLPASFDRYAFIDEIKARLLSGMAAAGFFANAAR